MTKKETPTPIDQSGEGAAMNTDMIARAADLNRLCDSWIQDNGPAYQWICSRVMASARRGAKTSVRELAERVRWGDFTARDGKPTKLSNSITAPLARRIISEHPEVRPYLTIKRSIVDVTEGLA